MLLKMIKAASLNAIWVLLSLLQCCMKSLVGVATRRFIPGRLCFFMEEKKQRQRGREKWEYECANASDHCCLTASGVAQWPQRTLLRTSRKVANFSHCQVQIFQCKTVQHRWEKGNSATQSCLWGRQNTEQAIFRSTHTNGSKKGESASHITQNDGWRLVWKSFGGGRPSFSQSSVKLQHDISWLEGHVFNTWYTLPKWLPPKTHTHTHRTW